MLSPKRVKHRKVQKGRMKGTAYRGSEISFGDYGLQATTCGYVTARQLEAARIAMTIVLGSRRRRRHGVQPAAIFGGHFIVKRATAELVRPGVVEHTLVTR